MSPTTGSSCFGRPDIFDSRGRPPPLFSVQNSRMAVKSGGGGPRLSGSLFDCFTQHTDDDAVRTAAAIRVGAVSLAPAGRLGQRAGRNQNRGAREFVEMNAHIK